jgi:CRP-like cAMP-binding protein
MIAETLKNAFDRYHSLPLSFWVPIADMGETITVEKESVLKKVDKTENYLYFIIEGSGGVLLWNKNNYVCTDMVLENDFLCDYLSFITRQATSYEVLTFEKSTLFRVSHSALMKYTDNSELGDKFWRYAITGLYVEKHYQYMQAFTNNAAQIYDLFLKHQPEVIKRIPQKYIASYIGVTPQSLSRIRNNG